MKTLLVTCAIGFLLTSVSTVYLYSARQESITENLRLQRELAEREERLNQAKTALPYYEKTASELEQRLKEFKGREDALIQNTESRVRLYEAKIEMLTAEVKALSRR